LALLPALLSYSQLEVFVRQFLNQRANPAVQVTWRIKPRQSPDLERYAYGH